MELRDLVYKAHETSDLYARLRRCCRVFGARIRVKHCHYRNTRFRLVWDQMAMCKLSQDIIITYIKSLQVPYILYLQRS